jgi:uncharacterized protein with GYD domain
MPKYLLQASYTTEGTKGLLQEGGSKRRAEVQKALKSLGGKLEAMYFAFGDPDVYVIVDLPDAATATALSLTVNATGTVRLKTTPLISADEVDEATKRTGSYRAPGQ